MVKPNGQSMDVIPVESGTTRARIKAAAAREFIEKGLDGARMQAIAERAGANKAMIYYYFQSKESLYAAIIREAFEEMFGLFAGIGPLESISIEEAIMRLVRVHFQFFAQNPHIPVLLARELHGGREIAYDVFREVFEKVQSDLMIGFREFIIRNKKTGQVRDVDPVQTIWNIIALDLFYFITKPVLDIIWPELAGQGERLLAKREKAIVDLLLNGLLPRD